MVIIYGRAQRLGQPMRIIEVTIRFFLTAIRLLWNRDLIEPRELFFLSCSTVAART